MSDVQWWLVWAVIAVHLVWSACNWGLYFGAKRKERRASNLVAEARRINDDATSLHQKIADMLRMKP